MTCDEAREHLWEYYDKQVPAALKSSLDAHVAQCQKCQAVLEGWRKVSHQAFAHSDRQVSPYLWTRVLARIEELEEKRVPWWAQWRWMSRVTAAVAVMVLAVTGYIFYQSGPSLESLIEGNTNPDAAIHLTSHHTLTQEETVAWVTGGELWEQN